MCVFAELVPRDQPERIRRGCDGRVVLAPQRLAVSPRHFSRATDQPCVEAWCERCNPQTSGFVYGRRHLVESFRVPTVRRWINRGPVVGVSVEEPHHSLVSLRTLLTGEDQHGILERSRNAFYVG